VADTQTAYVAGDTVMVFDAREWDGRDVGDNSQFWKPCRLLRVYQKHIFHGEQLATVRWPDGRVSDGHIVSAFRTPQKPDPTPSGTGVPRG
jgi:hypothetical protein